MDSREKLENVKQESLDSALMPEASDSGSAARRNAIGWSLFGLGAALLSACGKFVTKYDKNLRGEAPANPGIKSVTPTPTSTGGPDPIATATPIPDEKKLVTKGSDDSGIKIDVSTGVTDKTDKKGDVLDKSGKDKNGEGGSYDSIKFYGSKQSALLAVKFKTSFLSEGDLVSILAKKSDGAYLLASRRIQVGDLYKLGSETSWGLVVDTLCLNDATGIIFLFSKGSERFKVEFDGIEFHTKLNGIDVRDLGLLRRDTTKLDFFGVSNGFDQNAPSMDKTSDSAAFTPVGDMGHREGKDKKYYAATNASTWNVTELCRSADTNSEVRNVFGDALTDTSSTSKLFHSDRIVLVYVLKSNVYHRYMISVG